MTIVNCILAHSLCKTMKSTSKYVFFLTKKPNKSCKSENKMLERTFVLDNVLSEVLRTNVTLRPQTGFKEL